MSVEGLRPENPIRPELMLFQAPKPFGRVDPGVKWVGEPVWLEPGERRTLVVDMRHLEPQSS